MKGQKGSCTCVLISLCLLGREAKEEEEEGLGICSLVRSLTR